MTEDLEARFLQAADRFAQAISLENSSVKNAVKLQLYGLYKQALNGDCPLGDSEKPTSPTLLAALMSAFGARDAQTQKQDAWLACAGQPPDEAMRRYIQIVDELQLPAALTPYGNLQVVVSTISRADDEPDTHLDSMLTIVYYMKSDDYTDTYMRQLLKNNVQEAL